MDQALKIILAPLPKSAQPYAETWLASIGMILTVSVPFVPNVPAWVAGVTGALTVLGVYGQPNRLAEPQGDHVAE